MQFFGKEGELLEGLCLLVAQGGSLFKILPQDGSLLLFAQLVQPVVQLLILSVRLGNKRKTSSGYEEKWSL